MSILLGQVQVLHSINNGWSFNWMEDCWHWPTGIADSSFPSLGTLGDIPRFTDYGQNLPDATDKVVTAFTLFPAIMAQDTWSPAEKIQQTTYYLLIKQEYWKKQFQFDIAAGSSKQGQETWGMSETDQSSMEQTTGISVTADAGFSFDPSSSSISGTVTANLKVSLSTTSEKMSQATITSTYNNNGSVTASYAEYGHVTEYLFLRTNGTAVTAAWSVVIQNDTRTTSWPSDAPIDRT